MALPESFAPFFQRMIDDPSGALRALQADPDAFETALLREEGGRLIANGAIPAHGAITAIVFDEAGVRLGDRNGGWLDDIASFDDLPPARIESGRLMTLDTVGAYPVHAIWAPVSDALRWNLPSSARALADLHPRGRLLLVAGGLADEGPLDAACNAFGLTDLQTRVMKQVVRTGSARRAAERLSLKYGTVREVVHQAGVRMGVSNLPGAVRAVVAAAFGVLPDEGDYAAILADMLPLTERQAMIAVLVGNGLTRDEVALAANVSGAVVKKELEVIFATLDVGSAAELSRLIVEVRALRLFARSTDSMPGLLDPVTEPTRLMPRPNGAGPVAWSDYGPRSGKPVLIVHSNWCCRAVPRPLIAALHRRGFRPIAIDRPGFGMTALGRSTRADPYGQAVDDMLMVLDTLKIPSVPVIARCGAQFVIAAKHAAPGRIDRVVLVSPTPQTADTGLRRGIVGVVKEAFYRSPRLIEFFFRIISAQVSLARVETLTRAIVHGSATDEALCDDSAFLRDRLRAIRPLSTGRLTGAILEEQIISHGGYRFEPVAADGWTVLQGGQDNHNDMTEVEAYWSRLIPTARFVDVGDGGRFMTSSHPDLIADTLTA